MTVRLLAIFALIFSLPVFANNSSEIFLKHDKISAAVLEPILSQAGLTPLVANHTGYLEHLAVNQVFSDFKFQKHVEVIYGIEITNEPPIFMVDIETFVYRGKVFGGSPFALIFINFSENEANEIAQQVKKKSTLTSWLLEVLPRTLFSQASANADLCPLPKNASFMQAFTASTAVTQIKTCLGKVFAKPAETFTSIKDQMAKLATQPSVFFRDTAERWRATARAITDISFQTPDFKKLLSGSLEFLKSVDGTMFINLFCSAIGVVGDIVIKAIAGGGIGAGILIVLDKMMALEKVANAIKALEALKKVAYDNFDKAGDTVNKFMTKTLTGEASPSELAAVNALGEQGLSRVTLNAMKCGISGASP